MSEITGAAWILTCANLRARRIGTSTPSPCATDDAGVTMGAFTIETLGKD
jgi:hypothetical protein